VSASTSSFSNASTLRPSLTRSSLPPDSSSEVSSLGLLSPMHEHGEPSERFPVVDLSPEEVDSLPDTSQDEEIAQKLFGDLNCGLLGMPHDDNIIILSDFNKEEEVRMDDRDEVVPSSAASPLPMMMHLTRCTMVVVAVGFLIRCQMVVMMVETRSVRLRLLHQKGCPQGRALKSLRITIILH
jgi:hypothetical protein